MTPILELKNVSAGYDHEVILHQVNLKIYEHDFLGIIGPNGGPGISAGRIRPVW